MAAMCRPCIFIIGSAFSLLGKCFQAHGHVIQSHTEPDTDLSLSPSADVRRVLQKARQHCLREGPEAMTYDCELDKEAIERDVLGEMEVAARIMITGGDEREDAHAPGRQANHPQCNHYGREDSRSGRQ